MGTTARIAVNKTIYMGQPDNTTNSEGRTRSRRVGLDAIPFFAARESLMEFRLEGWFLAGDECAIECMLHMPAYEPVTWVALLDRVNISWTEADMLVGIRSWSAARWVLRAGSGARA